MTSISQDPRWRPSCVRVIAVTSIWGLDAGVRRLDVLIRVRIVLGVIFVGLITCWIVIFSFMPILTAGS